MPAPTQNQSPTDDLNLDSGLIPKQAATTDDLNLDSGLVPKSSAAVPGAYQTRKGGPILNSNTPAPALTATSLDTQAANDREAAQGAIHAVSGVVPGGDATIGVAKGLYKTGIGGASLLAKALNKAGIHGEEIDRLSRGDLSPFSQAMTHPEGFEEHAGSTAEDLGEWLAGEEGLKAVQSLAKIPQAGRLVKSLLNIGKSATIGAAQGGVKGAAEGDATGGVEGGAAGGAIGAGIGEVAGPGLKTLSRIFGIGGLTGEEALVKAGRPTVNEDANFRKALDTAGPRIVDAAKSTSLKTVGDFEDLLHNTAQSIRQNEFGPMIQRNAKQMVSAQPVAANIRSAITDQMREYAPDEAKELDDFAVKFAKDMPLGKAESDLQYFNAQLKKFYKANAIDQSAALKTNGTVAKYEAAADGLRDLIYGRLKELGEDAPEDLQKQYGALKTLERTFAKRATVSDRQAPLNLPQVLSLAGGASEAVSAVMAGHPVAALAGAIPIAVSTAAKMRNAPESLIRQGVKALGEEAAPKGPSAVGTAVKTAVKSGAALGGQAALTDPQKSEWVHVQDSNGIQWHVHPSDLRRMQSADPGVQLVTPN